MVDYPLMNINEGYNMTKGLQVPLQYVNQITDGVFMDLFIGLLWLGITLTSYFAQKRRNGDANFFATLSVVGLGVFLFMLILTIIPAITGKPYTALIGVTQLGIFLLLEIISIFIWFVTERNQY